MKSEKDLRGVREGAVIVAPTASRELIAIMQKACAVVTERGGVRSTAFLVCAREYDVPAVTGVEGLTEVISEGDLLQIDGTSGTVEVLRRKALVHEDKDQEFKLNKTDACWALNNLPCSPQWDPGKH